MDNNLDRNLKKILKGAAPPPPCAPDAADRIFAGALRRLDAEVPAAPSPALPKPSRWKWPLAIAAALALALGTWHLWPTPVTRIVEIEPLPPAPPSIHPREEILRPRPGESIRRELQDLGHSVLVVEGGSEARTVAGVDGRIHVELIAGSIRCDRGSGPDMLKIKTPLGEVLTQSASLTVKLEPQRDATMKKTFAALVMTVAVLNGEALVTGSGTSKLAVAGETVAITQAARRPDPVRSGQLVPTLADGRRGDPLEVRKHSVQATIRDQVALVEVDQVFFNPSDERLEGTFHFPLPAGATICRLAMYVGDNLMEGEIAEAARARRTFEALKIRRVDPALLEWSGGNQFKMRIFPIEPKSEKRVLLSYYQVLLRENDTVRFAYPLASDVLHGRPVGQIDVRVALSTTPSLRTVSTPGYEVPLKQEVHRAETRLSLEKTAPEKDFVVEYAIDRSDSELIALPFWHARSDEGYFLMILSPALEGVESKREMPGRYLFVLDSSGGQDARSFRLTVEAVRHALTMLKPTDRFGIVAYDTYAQSFSASRPRRNPSIRPGPPSLEQATPETLVEALAWLDKLKPLGASDLSEAWWEAAALAGDGPTQLVYVGSGLSALGSTQSGKLVQEADARLPRTTTVHCLGTGTIQNADFLDELARRRNGTSHTLTDGETMASRVAELMQDFGAPLYTNVQVAIDGVQASEILPAALPNVTAGRQLFVYGKYRGERNAKVRLTATVQGRPYAKEFNVAFGKDTVNTFVPPLWATRKIEQLQRDASAAPSDTGTPLVRSVVETSKRYTVMSQYTSFLVLETAEEYGRYGIERRVREFGPYAGSGGPSPAEQLRALQRQENSDPEHAGLKNSPDDKSLAADKPTETAGEKLALFDMDSDGIRGDGTSMGLDIAARTNVNFFNVSGLSRGANPFSCHPFSERRVDVFPGIDGRPDASAERPKGWIPSDPTALARLRTLAERLRTFQGTAEEYRIKDAVNEAFEKRTWTLAFDAADGRFASSRSDADFRDVCDGKRRTRLFPNLRHAVTAAATPRDLPHLATMIPGFVAPWTDGIDQAYVVTWEVVAKARALRLTARVGDAHFIRIFFESDDGPVIRMEQFVRGGEDQPEFILGEVMTCTELQTFNGVRIPTVFRTVRAENGRLPEKPTAQISRWSNIRINEPLPAADFSIVVPKNWGIRDLDAQANEKERRSISEPFDPSTRNVGE